MSMINKVKSLGARAVMSDADVRALLEKDHDEAKSLARQMCGASGMRRMALLEKLKPVLTAHSRAEESAVYDALLQVRKDEPPRALAQEGYVEHSLVDELLAKLTMLDPAGEVWHAHAQVLKELLEHHIDEEQTQTFAELGKHFSRTQLDAMGVRFQREKAALLTSMQRNTAPGSTRPGAAKKPARKRARPAAAAKGTRRARAAKPRTSARKTTRAKR